MAQTRTAATGVISPGAVGQPATTRSAGVAGSTEPDHRRVEPGDRAGSGEVSRGAATDDTPRSRRLDRTGLRVDHRQGGAVSVRQADRELSGTGALGRFQWEPATAGAHHQTGEFDVALLVGGSCPCYGTKHSGMAQQVFPPGHATRKE